MFMDWLSPTDKKEPHYSVGEVLGGKTFLEMDMVEWELIEYFNILCSINYSGATFNVKRKSDNDKVHYPSVTIHVDHPQDIQKLRKYVESQRTNIIT